MSKLYIFMIILLKNTFLIKVLNLIQFDKNSKFLIKIYKNYKKDNFLNYSFVCVFAFTEL